MVWLVTAQKAVVGTAARFDTELLGSSASMTVDIENPSESIHGWRRRCDVDAEPWHPAKARSFDF